MEINYLCPKCRSYLNIGTKIVLSVKVKNDQRGLLLFEKNLGEYEVKKNDLIEFEKGEMVDFYCPICHTNLTSDKFINLARIIQVEDEHTEFSILFSKIAGQQATYKIKDGGIEAFGADKLIYLEDLKKM